MRSELGGDGSEVTCRSLADERGRSMDSKRPGGATRHLILSRGRVLPLLVTLLLVFAVFTAMPAQAVHDETFQLDGDVSASTTTTIPPGPQLLDWDSLFNADGTNNAPLPLGFDAAKLTRDFVSSTATGGTFITSDTTTFATGSKDTLPISGWQCNFDNNVNSKIDVMNAYAASYTDPSGDQMIYFGLERNTNTGDANVAFWFLQDAVGCQTAGPSTTFTGQHKDGDLLIVSAFSKGGNVSTISVYKWNRPGNPVGVPGTLGTTPVASGVDCRAGTTGTGDIACAAANTTANGTAGTITIPWLTSNFKDGVGHALRTGEFFEGGLNLTDANLAGHCFNTFIGDTRSSTSLTSTLFDYAGGQLGECDSKTVTTPSVDGSTQIPANGTLAVTDSALVTVTGVPLFSGDVKFRLCGPFADGSTTLCGTGGVAAGTRTLTDVASPQTATSDEMTVTEVGRYCWAADYSGDLARGVPGSSDSRASECFTVTPRQSELTTQAGTTPVNLGEAVTDTAELKNTANHQGSGGPAGSTDGSINPVIAGAAAGGKITFTLYGPDSCSTLAIGAGTNPQDVTVSGDGTYGPVSFTPDTPGKYHWVASYNGDLPNTLGSTHNTACDDPNEDVVVRQIPTTTVTTPSDKDGTALTSPVPLGTKLFDKAVVTADQVGGPDVTGKVAFGLCDPNGKCDYDVGSAVAVTPVAAASPPKSTALSTPGVDANIAGTWCFSAVFTPDTSAYLGSQDDSATECVEVSKAPTTTVTTPSKTTGIAVGDKITDDAVVTALSTADGYPSGTINFYVCSPAQLLNLTQVSCLTGGSPAGSKEAIKGATDKDGQPTSNATSNEVEATMVGEWCFRAEYVPGAPNGGNYTGSFDSSKTECFTVRDSTSMSSAQRWVPNDTATVDVTGGTALNGTLKITLHEGGTCGGDPVEGQTYTKTLVDATSAAARTLSTENSEYVVTGAGTHTVSWLVEFIPDGGKFVDGSDHCESSTVNITD